MVVRPAPRTSLFATGRTLATSGLFTAFAAGVTVVLLLILFTGHRLTLGWFGVALLVGVLAAGLVHASRFNRHPAKTAQALSGVPLKPHQEAMGGDPLAHIQVVEQQGRRHRRACVNCGTMVKAGQTNCPNCDQMQLYACKGCKTQVRLDWTNCPECGRGLP